MMSLKTRRLAVPMVVACAGVFGSAATANAQSGGLSVTPASLENTAKRGTVGSLTLNNTTKETLKVTVVVRPWTQELFGNVGHRHARDALQVRPRHLAARSRSAPAPSAP